MDVPRGLPQAPWVLYYDGASRKPAGHAGLGAVLKNSRGQMVQEIKRHVGIGLTSGLAKYKALIAGLKKAKALQVKHLLAKGNSRLLINQVLIRVSYVKHSGRLSSRITTQEVPGNQTLRQVWEEKTGG